MKKILVTIISILFSAIAIGQIAEKPNSRIGLAINGGASHLFLGPGLNPMNSFSTPSWGWFAGGEFVYELEYKHFLFRTGFGTDYSQSMNLFQPPLQSRSINEYPTMQYHYEFSNYKEKTSMGLGYVPVMFGAEFSHFYFLVGSKVGVLPYLSSTQSSVDAYIWGTDDDVINPMEGLYTHNMGKFSYIGTKTDITFKQINVMASFEVGVCLGKKEPKKSKKKSKEAIYREMRRKKSFAECTHFKISLFADYGLMNMLDYKPNRVAYYTENDIHPDGGLIDIKETDKIIPQTMFGYEPHKNAVLNNLYAGIRFSMVYQIPHRPPKKGSMAYPHLVTVVRDARTGKPIRGATVKIVGKNQNTNKTRTIVKNTGGKNNNVDRSCPPGKYDFTVSYPGFISFDTVGYEHGDRFDTLYVNLYPQMKLTINVIDALSKNPIAARVAIYADNGERVTELPIDSGVTASAALNYDVLYELCAYSNGYYDTCYNLSLNQTSVTIEMKAKMVNKFILNNMYFATDETTVLPTSKKALNELYLFLSSNPDVRIRIIGHTDDVASDAYNQRLSEGRAKSIKKEMVKRGIDSERIETLGKGEKEPIAPNDSDKHRQMNRRVEIEVLSGKIELDYIRQLVK